MLFCGVMFYDFVSILQCNQEWKRWIYSSTLVILTCISKTGRLQNTGQTIRTIVFLRDISDFAVFSGLLPYISGQLGTAYFLIQLFQIWYLAKSVWAFWLLYVTAAFLLFQNPVWKVGSDV